MTLSTDARWLWLDGVDSAQSPPGGVRSQHRSLEEGGGGRVWRNDGGGGGVQAGRASGYTDLEEGGKGAPSLGHMQLHDQPLLREL